MKQILRKAFQLLSEKQRLALYRKMAHVPAEFQNPEFRVEIAQTQEDLQSAYKLLHDCYVGIKIIDPQPSGLRCNLFSFLPTSTIIVAKRNGKVIGTVSAIKDSSSGLPSDREFLKENNRFRRQGKVLVEASALAVDVQYRVSHCVSFLLMKYLYNYCRHCFRGNYMIGVVHPKSEDFYKALWQFEKNGEPVQYGSLNGAAAIHMTMDLSAEHFDKVTRDFGREDRYKNLGSMITCDDPRFHYPQAKSGLTINPVITPQTLKYFCLEQKEVWSRLSLKEKQTLIHVYSTYFGAASMREFRNADVTNFVEKEYRTPLHLSSLVTMGDKGSFSEILDLTSKGAFVSWNDELPGEGESVRLAFRFEGKMYYIPGTVAWKNDHRALHRGRGFGIRFSLPVPQLTATLQSLLYGKEEISAEGTELASAGT